MFIVIGVFFWQNNFQLTGVYFYCDSVIGCDNPLYECDEYSKLFNGGEYLCTKGAICDKYPAYCEDKVIPYQEHIGKKIYSELYTSLIFVLMFATFLINHLYYVFNYGKRNKTKG
jgi:hypothetical protein